jgi:hypothetical protein
VTVFDDLSPAVRSRLEAAGWRPGRTVPIDTWDEVLRREGHLLSPVAAEILTGLGGLRVEPGPAAKFRQPLLFEPELAGSGAYDIADSFAEALEVILLGAREPRVLPD